MVAARGKGLKINLTMDKKKEHDADDNAETNDFPSTRKRNPTIAQA